MKPYQRQLHDANIYSKSIALKFETTMFLLWVRLTELTKKINEFFHNKT